MTLFLLRNIIYYSLIKYLDKEPSVPSVYFIGKDGSPLDIIKGNDDLGKLNPRIDSILSKAGVAIESGKNLKLSKNFYYNLQIFFSSSFGHSKH